VLEGRQMTNEDLERAQRDRRLVFWLQILYLLALAALAVLYFTETIRVRHFVGTVPTAVPWFGALGAVLISLTGVFTWCENWDVCYRYWHRSGSRRERLRNILPAPQRKNRARLMLRTVWGRGVVLRRDPLLFAGGERRYGQASSSSSARS